VKVRADSRPNSEKVTVLQFKWEFLLNFVKIRRKSIFSPLFCHFVNEPLESFDKRVLTDVGDTLPCCCYVIR